MAQDGADDRQRDADDEDFRLSDGTAMAWVYYTGTLTGAVIGKPYGPADNDAWLLFVDPEGGGLATVAFESAGEVSRGNTMFDMERWTHVAITWTASRKRIYTDGTMVFEGVAPLIDYDSHDVLIGIDEDADSPYIPFGGALDDVRVYHRELTADQIAAAADARSH